ncbi:MAG: peptidoglycan-binding protein [Clostridiales bacterium]|nr:peptidoglycan-binding protein [Clostridiales bacterium]
MQGIFSEVIGLTVLREGSTGAGVELLQTGLIRAGFLNGGPDGIFGSNTLAALKAFQKDNGTAPDGIAGRLTWNALMPWLRGFINYSVKSGDTFASIAVRFGITLREILAANPGITPEELAVSQRITVPLPFDVVPTDISWTSELLNITVEGLVKRYPFIRRRSIGQSVMGKPLELLIIGKGTKKVCYNAGHHANEWITTPVLMKFTEQYAKAYVNGGIIDYESAKRLYENYLLYVVPMVDPDGVDLVNSAIPEDSYYYRQAVRYSGSYPDIPFPSGWKANINGVDLNLNYPAGWKLAREIKYGLGYTSPGPRDFVGAAPLTQPESYAMYRLTVSNDFLLTLSYHTQGEIIYWKYRDYLPEKSLKIGEKMSLVSGYPLVETPKESGNAGYKDWFIKTYDRPGYTIEVGKGKNPLPIEQFEKIYKDNTGILITGMTGV